MGIALDGAPDKQASFNYFYWRFRLPQKVNSVVLCDGMMSGRRVNPLPQQEEGLWIC